MKLPLQFIKELLSATDAVNFYKKEDDGWNREYHFKAEQVLEALEMNITWTPETNRIPWGLLTEDEQAALQECSHGWEVYIYDQWETSKAPAWCSVAIYRAKPAPKRIVVWLHYDDECLWTVWAEKDEAQDSLNAWGGFLKRIEMDEDGSNVVVTDEVV